VRLLRSNRGFSVVEMLLSTVIGGIVLTSAFDLYVESSKTTQGQSEAVQMQLQVKSAMDLMVRQMQFMYGSPTISTTLTANDTISFMRIVDSGYSSGGNTDFTLADTRKTWQSNEYAGQYSVRILSGKGMNAVHPISGNNGTTLTLSTTWAQIPDTTSLYVIYRNEGFTLTAAHKLGYQRGSGAYPIAEDITNLAFSLPDSTSVTIALTGRTSNPDPHTGLYNSYSMADTVRKRN
jgi:prepilin-type N-terminal cleavage/methylation domain-containing protein